jgi:hypothetical protein
VEPGAGEGRGCHPPSSIDTRVEANVLISFRRDARLFGLLARGLSKCVKWRICSAPCRPPASVPTSLTGTGGGASVDGQQPRPRSRTPREPHTPPPETTAALHRPHSRRQSRNRCPPLRRATTSDPRLGRESGQRGRGSSTARRSLIGPPPPSRKRPGSFSAQQLVRTNNWPTKYPMSIGSGRGRTRRHRRSGQKVAWRSTHPSPPLPSKSDHLGRPIARRAISDSERRVFPVVFPEAAARPRLRTRKAPFPGPFWDGACGI